MLKVNLESELRYQSYSALIAGAPEMHSAIKEECRLWIRALVDEGKNVPRNTFFIPYQLDLFRK